MNMRHDNAKATAISPMALVYRTYVATTTRPFPAALA